MMRQCKEIAVTLARPSDQKIENADFLAQADQQGTGPFVNHIACRVTCLHRCLSKVQVSSSASFEQIQQNVS